VILEHSLPTTPQGLRQVFSRIPHPEVALLKQVKGVGTLIVLTYVLTLDDPHRFRRSRYAGCFLGLRITVLRLSLAVT
jgi:hypothetical protein